MNRGELNEMELELRRLGPASTPTALIERVLSGLPDGPTRNPGQPVTVAGGGNWWMPWLRWLTPATAVALVALGSLRSGPGINRAAAAGFQADAVRLSQEFLSDFEAVAELPSGEPVRFLCREWKDTAVFQDSRRGLVLEQNVPRLEVIPVGFETY